MKTLYESLLDIDDLENNSDTIIKHTRIHDKEFIDMYGGVEWEFIDEYSISPKKARYYKIMVDNKFKPLSYFFNDVDTIVFTGSGININTYDGNILSSKTLCKNITFDKRLYGPSIMTSEIRDMHINYFDRLQINQCNEISNTILNSSRKMSQLKFTQVGISEIPTLNNVSSNTESLLLQGYSIFEGKKINNILDTPYTIKVHDSKKEQDVDVKIKDFKKINAIVNNKKRYKILEPIIHIKPGIKMKDLIDVSGFSDLKRISIESQNIMIEFLKTEEHYNYREKLNIFEIDDWTGYIFDI